MLGVLVLALLSAAAGGWVLLGSSLLDVERITVEGAHQVDPARVRSLLQFPAGTPLARVDTAAAARAVTGLPVVAEARVRRRWPHTLAVSVSERVPVAVAPAGSSYDVLARDGVVLRTVGHKPNGLPLVLAGSPPERPPAAAGARAAALDVLAALPPELAGSVRSLGAPGPEAVTLNLGDGRRVVWGNPDQSPAKAAVLAALLSRVPSARTYDVSAPAVPTTQ